MSETPGETAPQSPEDERDALEAALLAVLLAAWLRTTREIKLVLVSGQGTWSAQTASAGYVPGTAQAVWDEQVTASLAEVLAAHGLTPEQIADEEAQAGSQVSWVDAAVLAVLAAAVLYGWSVTQTERAVQDVLFGRSTPQTRLVDLPPGVPSSVDTALVLTARDLATTTSALEALRLGQEAGAKTKTWRSMHDGRVRPAHAMADGQTVPLGGMFDVGGFSMEYPGDSRAAPAEMVANCRCVLDVV